MKWNWSQGAKGSSLALFVFAGAGFCFGIGLSEIILGSFSYPAILLSLPWGVSFALLAASGERGLACGLAFWALFGFFVDKTGNTSLIFTVARRSTLHSWLGSRGIDPVAGGDFVFFSLVAVAFHILIRSGALKRPLRNILGPNPAGFRVSELFGFGVSGLCVLGWFEPVTLPPLSPRPHCSVIDLLKCCFVLLRSVHKLIEQTSSIMK